MIIIPRFDALIIKVSTVYNFLIIFFIFKTANLQLFFQYQIFIFNLFNKICI